MVGINTIDCALIEEPLCIMKKDIMETLKSVISEHDEIIAVYLYEYAIYKNQRAKVQLTRQLLPVLITQQKFVYSI